MHLSLLIKVYFFSVNERTTIINGNIAYLTYCIASKKVRRVVLELTKDCYSSVTFLVPLNGCDVLENVLPLLKLIHNNKID